MSVAPPAGARRAARPPRSVSALGSQMTFLALPWFVLATTGSAAQMGVVLAVELLPIALLGIPSGTLVARLGARRTMLYGDLARVPLMASVPLLHELGVLLVPAAARARVADRRASSRRTSPRSGSCSRSSSARTSATVAQANAVVEGAQRATALLGPPLAGLLIAASARRACSTSTPRTFLVLVRRARAVRAAAAAARADRGGRGVLAGVRFLLRDRLLRVLGITALFLNRFGQMLARGAARARLRDFGGARSIAGAFFAAFGAARCVGSSPRCGSSSASSRSGSAPRARPA